MIDPEKSKERNYKFLCELHEHILAVMKPGVSCKDVYSAAVAFVEKKRPDLKEHLVKNFGFLVL